MPSFVLGTDKMDESKLREQIKDRIRKMRDTLPVEDYPFPLYVIVEPTNVCNLSCAMCPSKNQTRPRGQMSIETWEKIVDEVAEKSPQTVIWPAIMGESSLLRDKFITMLEYARSRGVGIIWNTNAVPLDGGLIDTISQLGLKEIIIGLDAFSAEVYTKIRCGGDFTKATENTRQLIKACGNRTKITVQFIVQDDNEHEVEEFKAYWLAQGAVVKIRPRLGWGESVETPELLLEQSEREGPCPWLVRTVSVHWNGAVVQCDADWDQQRPAGNVNETSIEDIWRNELASRRRRHREGDFDFDPCRHCRDWQAGLSQYFYPERA